MPLAFTFLATTGFLLFHIVADRAYERFPQPLAPIILPSVPDGAARVEARSARFGSEPTAAEPMRASLANSDETLPGALARHRSVTNGDAKNLFPNRAPENVALKSSGASRAQKAHRRSKLIRAGSPPARREEPAGIPRETLRAPFIRFDGPSDWSIDDFARIEEFYRRTFGRPPPVSAMGQSETHDRLALDHREAIDIAVRPDSEEGRALMIYLRAAGIPFIAFRGRFRGISTGAHIHIGRPSPRLLEVHQRTQPLGGEEAVPG